MLSYIRDDMRFNRLENEDNLKIVTTYHTSIKKRVIVDGFHKAAALEAEIKNKERFAIPSQVHCLCYLHLYIKFHPRHS